MAGSEPNRVPPPLPPRAPSHTAHLTPYSEPPPPYAEFDLHSLSSSDPRSSSTQSLGPADTTNQDGRRKLLLIYIHGFMGDETSFQSFPLHVHNLVTVTLRETHAVHTKIYPRYRSRNSIELASEQFSKWLAPHLTEDTDTILLGHSMGGLLSAEIVLLPPHHAAAGQVFRHRILGTINFDVPFLGMHPGVIASGLESIFRPAEDKSPEPKPRDSTQPESSQEYVASSNSSTSTFETVPPPNRTDTLFAPRPSDSNYNPSFSNDVILPVRKGWDNAFHFINKHSDGLIKASRQYVKSHLQFGGAMADYSSLRKRYVRIRALEEDDEATRKAALPGLQRPPRVRFVNYYTASTGRPKKPKSPSATPSNLQSPDPDIRTGLVEAGLSMSSLNLSTCSTQDLQLSESHSHSLSPRISIEDSIEEHREDVIVPKHPDEVLEEHLSPVNSESNVESSTSGPDMQHIDPVPIEELEEPELDHGTEPTGTNSTPLPPSQIARDTSPSVAIPPEPTEPPELDLSMCTSKEARKAAEKEHEQAVKMYKRAIKEREHVVKEQKKREEKLAKEARREEERQAKEKKKAEERAAKEAKKGVTKEQKGETKEGEISEDAAAEGELTGEELRLEKERQRMEAEERRMAEAEKERLKKQREMLGLPPEEPEESGPEPEPKLKEVTKISSTEKGNDGTDRLTTVNTITGATPTNPSPSPSSLHSPSPSLSSPPAAPSLRSRSAPSTTASSAGRAHSPASTMASASLSSSTKPAKPPRERKFCMLPWSSRSGRPDPAWVRVYMEGVDEVGAHCGLFFVDERYERLVGEVAERIEKWVMLDWDERVCRELGG